MRTMQFPYAAVVFVLCAFSCATGKQHINTAQPVQSPNSIEQPVLTLYGVGDAGENDRQSGAVIRHLAQAAKDDTQPGIIFFLGDNVYPAGLAAPGHADHQYGVSLLQNQIGLLSDYHDRIVFIPGNHDWNEFKPGGWEAIRRQSDFINQMGKSNLRFIPANGCGGPEIMSPVANVNIIIIDSQWWIQDWTKEPDMNQGCEIRSREQLMQPIRALLNENPDEQFVIVMHHPVESRGPHGGFYTFRDHMFPLSKVVKWLYLPLPVIGSIYPWYRTVIGHPQDIRHKGYRSLQQALYDAIGDRKNVIFLSGHEHSLQYVLRHGNHVVISGSGSKQNAVAAHPDLVYGHKAPGYVVLNFYADGSVWLGIVEVDEAAGSGEIVFQNKIVGEKAR